MTTTQLEKPVARGTALGGKYLTFRLAAEEYGIAILKVREIIGLLEITAVPQMPAYVKGVVNLRGTVVPVIDLRLKLGLEPTAYTEQTCTIVVAAGTPVGLIVDTVQEVLDIADHEIDPPPPLGTVVEASCVLGLGKVKDGVKILLDIDRLLNGDDLPALA